MDGRENTAAAAAAAPRGLVGSKEPGGEIVQLLDDQNMQTEKLIGIINELTSKLAPVLEISETDRADSEPQKQPLSSVGQGILRNTNNVRQAQGLLSELLHRIQL